MTQNLRARPDVSQRVRRQVTVSGLPTSRPSGDPLRDSRPKRIFYILRGIPRTAVTRTPFHLILIVGVMIYQQLFARDHLPQVNTAATLHIREDLRNDVQLIRMGLRASRQLLYTHWNEAKLVVQDYDPTVDLHRYSAFRAMQSIAGRSRSSALAARLRIRWSREATESLRVTACDRLCGFRHPRCCLVCFTSPAISAFGRTRNVEGGLH